MRSWSLLVLVSIVGCGKSAPSDVKPTDAEGDLAVEEDTYEPPPKCEASVSKGPWSLQADETSVKIRWEACVPGEASIRYAPEAGGAEVTAKSKVTDTRVETTNGAPLRRDADYPGTYYMHEVALTGLTAGTCYRYTLFDNASMAGPTARVCTAKPPGADFSFAAVADTNPGFGPTKALLEKMYAKKPDFTIHAGDLQYYASGLETYAYWFGEMSALFRGGAFYHSIGNHESEQPKEREEYVDRFWGLAGFDGTKDYFRFQSGGVWFFTLDTEEDTKITSTQGTWLEKQLDDASKKPGYRFSVLYFHRPWVTCGDKSDSTGNRTQWAGNFKKYNVKLVVQGHMHAYERFELDDVTWLTIGGGGGALGNPDENITRPECASRKSSGKFFHGVLLDVKPGQLVGTTLDDKGAVRDSFTMVVP